MSTGRRSTIVRFKADLHFFSLEFKIRAGFGNRSRGYECKQALVGSWHPGQEWSPPMPKVKLTKTAVEAAHAVYSRCSARFMTEVDRIADFFSPRHRRR